MTHCGIRLQRTHIPFKVLRVLFDPSSVEEDFSVLNFLSMLSDLPLIRENGTQKAEQYWKLQFANKVGQNTNLAKLPSDK